jgi:hypothetical protein
VQHDAVDGVDDGAGRARFDFYECVVVATSDGRKAAANGERGVVVGRAGGGRECSYAVFLYSTQLVAMFDEAELRWTGERDAAMEAEARTRPSVRVRVDARGRGHIVDEASDAGEGGGRLVGKPNGDNSMPLKREAPEDAPEDA